MAKCRFPAFFILSAHSIEHGPDQSTCSLATTCASCTAHSPNWRCVPHRRQSDSGGKLSGPRQLRYFCETRPFQAIHTLATCLDVRRQIDLEETLDSQDSKRTSPARVLRSCLILTVPHWRLSSSARVVSIVSCSCCTIGTWTPIPSTRLLEFKVVLLDYTIEAASQSRPNGGMGTPQSVQRQQYFDRRTQSLRCLA